VTKTSLPPRCLLRVSPVRDRAFHSIVITRFTPS
jgi:hypothetical protein